MFEEISSIVCVNLKINIVFSYYRLLNKVEKHYLKKKLLQCWNISIYYIYQRYVQKDVFIFDASKTTFEMYIITN